MPTFDAHANLALATVAVAPSPSTSGTSLIIASGYAALFPAVPFNATVWPSTANPTDANAEIVRVTNITGDIFTIVRAQEGTTAKAIAAGYKIGNTVTAKVFTDIETAINNITAGSGGITNISAGTLAITDSQVIFSNSNGITFGASSNIITASFSGGGAGGAAISAGGESQNTGTVVFSNANGVTFGLSNNGVMTASVGAGVGAGSISAGANSVALGQVVFSNSNGVSFGLNGSTVTAAHDGLTSQSNQAFSAQGGSSAFQTLEFANSNGITFSNSGGSVVASHNGLTSQSNQAASASNGSFAFQTLGFSNANNVTFGTSAGSIITASVAPPGAGSVNFSAGAASADLATIVFSNSNGVSFGLNGATITASAAGGAGGATLSHFAFPQVVVAKITRAITADQIFLNSFVLPEAISFDYMRMPVAMGNTQTTLATLNSGSASASAAISHNFYAMFYTQGTGASSDELNTVASTQMVSIFSQAVSITNSSQGSYSQGITAYKGTAQTTLTTQYSISNTNYSFTTSDIGSNFSATRLLDIPFATSLSAGNYWIGLIRVSASASGGAAGFANMSNASVGVNSQYVATQIDDRFLYFGETQSTRAQLGGGRVTANTATPAASVDLGNMNSNGSNAVLYFQLHRS